MVLLHGSKHEAGRGVLTLSEITLNNIVGVGWIFNRLLSAVSFDLTATDTKASLFLRPKDHSLIHVSCKASNVKDFHPRSNSCRQASLPC